MTSIDTLSLAVSEVIFWIESDIVSFAFSCAGYDALLSRMHHHPRSPV